METAAKTRRRQVFTLKIGPSSEDVGSTPSRTYLQGLRPGGQPALDMSVLERLQGRTSGKFYVVVHGSRGAGFFEDWVRRHWLQRRRGLQDVRVQPEELGRQEVHLVRCVRGGRDRLPAHP